MGIFHELRLFLSDRFSLFAYRRKRPGLLFITVVT